MLFVLLFPAVVVAGILSSRLCARTAASRIYGSLLGSLLVSIGVTLVWAIKQLVAMPGVTLWRLVTLSFHALCFTYPLLFLGSYLLLVYIRRGPRTKAKSAGVVPVFFSTILVAMALGMLLSGFYALKIEPNWIEVTHTTIHTSKLKAGSRPLRIVQLSDLHIENWGYRERRTIEIVKRLDPDFVLLTGDYTNFTVRCPEVQRFMKSLHAKYGVYAIHGNWNPMPIANSFFKDTDVHVLEYGHDVVRTEAGRVVLAGIPWYAWDDSHSVLRGVKTSDAFTILMSHMPEGGEHAPPGVDLVLAGHTHGGQVRIPGIGPVITFSRVHRDRAAGLSKFPNGVLLYVNRGLGMEGGNAPQIRFLCRPEVAVFTIKGDGK